MTRVLIGGVGYRHLRDYSFGVALVDALASCEWRSDVSVEDISYSPIALAQRLQDDLPERPFDLIIVVGVLNRPGRTPGTLAVYRWDHALPEDEHLHQAMTEAVTGIIALDNTLVVAEHFDALPTRVVVVEVEPQAHEFGDAFSQPVADAFVQAARLVADLARHPFTANALPEGGLPRNRERHSGVVLSTTTDDTTIH